MGVDVSPVAVSEILALRELHRAEMQCQIVHDSLHERGITRPYVIRTDGEVVGYGTVVGFDNAPKDIVDEFFLFGPHRGGAADLFRAFVAASGAKTIEAQTNDPLLLLMLFDVAGEIRRARILFEDGFTTDLNAPDVTFRSVEDGDRDGLLDGKPSRAPGSSSGQGTCATNRPSRATLQRAGMVPCGGILTGVIGA